MRNGACFSSGVNSGGFTFVYCFPNFDRPIIGCRDASVSSPSNCPDFSYVYGYWTWSTWLTPAMTESECRNSGFGRAGCVTPEQELHLVWVQEEYCDCVGGTWEHAWEWVNGTWIGGQVRNMSWIKAENVSGYEWTDGVMSFDLLEKWLIADVEERLLYPLKSEV